MNEKSVIIGMSGASGAIYTERLIKALCEKEYMVHLIITKYAQYMIQTELEIQPQESFDNYLLRKYPHLNSHNIQIHLNQNLADPLASGSSSHGPMIVLPCSMKTLSSITHGYSAYLLERAADVTLKENLPLILAPRETPLSIIHLENMLLARQRGIQIVPAMPAFYQKPKTLDDIADFMAGRILNLLHIPHQLFPAWKEPN